MRHLHKKTTRIIYGIAIIIMSRQYNVYGACDICTQPSDELTQYIQTSTKALDIITATYVNGPTVQDKEIDDDPYIHMGIGKMGGASAVRSRSSLYEDTTPSIIRDMDILDTHDRTLYEFYAPFIGNPHKSVLARIPSDTLASLQNILNKENILLDMRLHPTASVGEVASVMLAIHAYHKLVFLYTIIGEGPSPQNLVTYLQNTYPHVATFTLSPDHINRIDNVAQTYACAYGPQNECDSGYTDTVQTLGMLSKHMQQAQSSREDIQASYDRLKSVRYDTFGGGNVTQSYLDRKETFIAELGGRRNNNTPGGFINTRGYMYGRNSLMGDENNRRKIAGSIANGIRTQAEQKKYEQTTSAAQREHDRQLRNALYNAAMDSHAILLQSRQRTFVTTPTALLNDIVSLSITMSHIHERIGIAQHNNTITYALAKACQMQCTNVPMKKCQA